MMPSNGPEQIERDYLQRLYDQTKGDASVQVSMYEIGETLQLDRDTSSQVAQNLIGFDLVEIKTLSGGIGISAAGIAAIEVAGGGADGTDGAAPCLSDAPVLSPADIEAVEQVTGFLKKEAGGLGLSFESLTELVADLRTLEAQLTSSRPKTDIVRACLQSIAALMAGLGHNEALSRLRALAGE